MKYNTKQLANQKKGRVKLTCQSLNLRQSEKKKKIDSAVADGFPGLLWDLPSGKTQQTNSEGWESKQALGALGCALSQAKLRQDSAPVRLAGTGEHTAMQAHHS